MRKYKIFFIVLIFFGYSLSTGDVPSPQPDHLYGQALVLFEKFVAEQMARDRIPGLSIGLMKDDFTWAKGFGYADLENRIPARAESSYRLASVTKTITATAVLQMVEAGKVDLDADVRKYVPYFPPKKWPITVRQLLGHLGGISHYKNYDVEGHIKEPKTTRQALDIFKDFDLVAEPGTRFNYSSYGFNLLGAVVEEVSGLSYGEYLRKYIFEPLGMADSRLDNPRELIRNRVRGYQIINGELRNSEYVDISSRFAGGGVRSTVIDLIKFGQGIISGKLLKEKTLREMFSSMAVRDGFFTGYGMGWGVRPWKGHFQVSHGGSQPETRTHLLIFPPEKFAVAVAANLEGANLIPYVKKLAELILDEDLDSAAYAGERTRQVIYDACEEIFSFGLSYVDWMGVPLTLSRNELEEAFAYFKKFLNESALKQNPGETRRKIMAGIHPASGLAFAKVGSFMAFELKKAKAEAFEEYHDSGPLAFFHDYVELSKANGRLAKKFHLSKELEELISVWKRDWERTYTDYVRSLWLTPESNLEEVETNLKRAFAGASFYADFSQDMSSLGRAFLEKNDAARGFRILEVSRDLYPQSPVPYASLAMANLWVGKGKEAQELYKKAASLDPFHPVVSAEQLFSFAGQLARTRKNRELFILAEIILELHPKEARAYAEVGNWYLRAGQMQKAAELFKKALEINPNLEAAREGLKKTEK